MFVEYKKVVNQTTMTEMESCGSIQYCGQLCKGLQLILIKKCAYLSNTAASDTENCMSYMAQQL